MMVVCEHQGGTLRRGLKSVGGAAVYGDRSGYEERDGGCVINTSGSNERERNGGDAMNGEEG